MLSAIIPSAASSTTLRVASKHAVNIIDSGLKSGYDHSRRNLSVIQFDRVVVGVPFLFGSNWVPGEGDAVYVTPHSKEK